MLVTWTSESCTGPGVLVMIYGELSSGTLARAAESIDHVPAELRDISSLTVCLGAGGLQRLKQRIQRFRRELLELSTLEQDAKHLRGSRSDGVPFGLASTLSATFDLVTVPAGTPFDARFVTLGFDVAVWIHGVDVHGVVPDASGVVVINSAAHPSLLTTFESQLGLGVSLYADANHDGYLDPEEATPIAGVH